MAIWLIFCRSRTGSCISGAMYCSCEVVGSGCRESEGVLLVGLSGPLVGGVWGVLTLFKWFGSGDVVSGGGVSSTGSTVGVGSGEGELDEDWWYCCRYCRDVEAWVVSGDDRFRSLVSESHLEGMGSSSDDAGSCMSVRGAVVGSTACSGGSVGVVSSTVLSSGSTSLMGICGVELAAGMGSVTGESFRRLMMESGSKGPMVGSIIRKCDKLKESLSPTWRINTSESRSTVGGWPVADGGVTDGGVGLVVGKGIVDVEAVSLTVGVELIVSVEDAVD